MSAMNKSESYFTGYESMISAISAMGHSAARDAFNLKYPPGQPWNGATEALAHAHGEFQALFDKRGSTDYLGASS